MTEEQTVDLTPEARTIPVVEKTDGNGERLHAYADRIELPVALPGHVVVPLCGEAITVAIRCIPGTFSFVNPDRRCAGCAARVEETAR